jgi:hypothetical protein
MPAGSRKTRRKGPRRPENGSMHNSTNYFEKAKLRERLREVLVLFVFIFGAAAASVVCADLIIYPLTSFSIRNKAVLNFIVRDLIRISVPAAALLFAAWKIYRLHKDGFTAVEIAGRAGLAVSRAALSVLAVTLAAAVLVVLIYLLLSYNYYLLYKLSSP